MPISAACRPLHTERRRARNGQRCRNNPGGLGDLTVGVWELFLAELGHRNLPSIKLVNVGKKD